MQLIRILLALLVVVTTARGAEPEPVPQRVMTLVDCIQAALEYNLGLRIARYGPQIARYNLGGAYGAYDPEFSFSGEHDYSLSPGGIDAQNRTFSGTETESNRFNTGFRGLLPWGLTYDLGGSLSDRTGTSPSFAPDFSQSPTITYSTNINLTGPGGPEQIVFASTNFPTVQIRTPFENTSGSIGFLQLRQPVLKNFWIDSTRLSIAVNKRSLKISELALRSQVMTTVTSVEQAYYNLIFARENVKVQEKALELAERLLAENKKKVEVGALAQLDEKQAESQVAQSRADLLAAKNARSIQENTLKGLLTDDYKTLHEAEVVPAETLMAVPEAFDLQRSWQVGLSQRPDLLQKKLELEQQGYVVRYQKNQLFPQVDLVGSYGFSASGREYSSALGQFQGAESPFYSAGAEFSIPLGNRAVRNTYKVAKATKERMLLELKSLEQNAMVLIDNAVKQAQSDFERVDATHQFSLYAEAALDAEQKKLENGKSTSFEVLRLQRDLTTARSQEIRALADYNNSLAQLALAEATTLERRRLTLDVK